ncbi:MAG TPA: hypothetical protein VI997_09195 [Candidatus Thermoplasmatota archaeon]|nr:hypothetical protein [Candidatus Thermoplasmatota archaeon]
MRRRSVVALAVAAVGVVLVALAPDAPPGAHRLGERIGDGAVPAPDARILARGVV